MADFTLDATIQGNPNGSIALDAEVAARGATMDAWIVEERWRHHRIRDHFGAESDLFVVLSDDVGGYIALTPIHFVLDDLVSRIEALESNNRIRHAFTMDAYFYAPEFGSYVADGIVKGPQSGSFSIDAHIIDYPQANFGLDAFIGEADTIYNQISFTMDAFIV